MGRFFIEGDEVKFVRKDTCLVDAVFYDGRVIEDLEPRRLFPVSGGDKYITLLDKDNKEHAIIRDLDRIIPESREVILACLKEYYLIPQIKRILERSEKFGTLKWTVETDRGIQTFTIRNPNSDLKVLYDGRILILDSNDNRYEIKDKSKLDKNSKKLLNNDL